MTHPHPDHEAIRRRLLSLMGDMAQRELARICGVAPSTLHQQLHTPLFSVDVLVRSAVWFDVSLDWLVLGVERDPAEEKLARIRRML